MKNVILLFLFIGTTLFGQKIKLQTPDKEPIYNALVQNLENTVFEFSDSNGIVVLDRFKDEEMLEITHPSFYTHFTSKRELVKNNLSSIYLFKKTELLEEVVIDNRSGDRKSEIFVQTFKISKEEVELMAPQTTADMLQQTGGVFVQKSQQGGGSPNLRGFEANRVLLVIDGVRMNNAIYRGGHLQNSITIDNAVLESTDVIMGPYSLMYGSDAIGGVIHFKTKDPVLAVGDSNVYFANGYIRSASANKALSTHVNFNLGYKKLGVFGGVTVNKFGDLMMGKRRTHGFDDFGKINHYVTQFNGEDSMVVNSNPNLHVNSGYNQVDGIFKILYQPNKYFSIVLNTQTSTSSNIPRFDKLNEYKNGKLRFAEWHYGPQKRLFQSLEFNITKPKKIYDRVKAIFAYQRIEESRISRDYKSTKKESNIENLGLASINFDFVKYFMKDKSLKFNYGLETTQNNLSSIGVIKDIKTHELDEDNLESRYPGNGSSLSTFSSYLSLQKTWADKHILKGGFRYGSQTIQAYFKENKVTDALGLDEFYLLNIYTTGSIGYIYYLNKNVKLSSGISRGYKSPNIDDFGKIFEKKGELTVPNEVLVHETANNWENRISYKNKKGFQVDFTLFSNLIENIMVKDTFSINGSNTINIDGEDLILVTNKNLGLAHLYGSSLGLNIPIGKQFEFNTTHTIVKGEMLDFDEKVPHIPPLFGRAAVKYQKDQTNAIIYIVYNGRKFWDNFSPSTDNQSESLDQYGSPGWWTLNMSYRTKFWKNIFAQIAVENILDVHYKAFSSGVSGPGRNIIATISYKM